ncbi:hypothetical protein U1Q18_042112 [Sarracenia purpurea var. burkii]
MGYSFLGSSGAFIAKSFVLDNVVVSHGAPNVALCYGCCQMIGCFYNVRVVYICWKLLACGQVLVCVFLKNGGMILKSGGGLPSLALADGFSILVAD